MNQPEVKYCADCGEEMVIRKNRQNDEEFYGCPNFPSCKYTESIPTEEF